MEKLLIYLVTVDTSHASKKLSIDESFAVLEKHLKVCDKLRGSQGVNKGKNVFDSILVAPEYLFSEYTGKIWSAKRKAISAPGYYNILGRLEDLSKNHGKTLIVPGTIWHEEIASSVAKKREVAQSTLIRELELKFGSTTSKTVKPSTPSDNVALMNYNPRESSLKSGAKSTDTKLKDLGKTMKSEDVKTVRNACAILLNSNVVAFYEKKTGFDETYDGPNKGSFFISTNKNTCPVIGGFKFGFEICFDHGNGVLKSRKASDIFFHVVVSDYVDTNNNNICVQQGGYFIHASTNKKQTRVRTRTSKGIEFCKKVATGDSNSKAYLVDVPEQGKAQTGYEVKPKKVKMPGMEKDKII